MNGLDAKFRLEPHTPGYKQIAFHLRQRILQGDIPPGSKLPTIQELANRFGTTYYTVHCALTPLVKEGLLVRRRGKGTFVRQHEKKLMCVGVYDCAGSLRTSPFEQALQTALKEELAAAGIEIDVWLDPRPLAEQGEPWMPLVRAAEHREFQALIVINTNIPRLRWQRQLPVPTAFSTGAEIPNAVGTDLAQFAEMSVQTLAQQGCRSVGLIFPGVVTNPDGTRHGFEGLFERLMDQIGDLGLTVKNEWMRVPTVNVGNGPGTEQFGHEEFLRLWAQSERPEGLIVFPDTAVRGVILGLLERQVRVPTDLKLVLHKNEAIELYCPLPVTFAVFSERKLARALIQQVQKQFRGETCEPILISFDSVSSANS